MTGEGGTADTGSRRDRVFSVKSRPGWNNDLGVRLGPGGDPGILC